MYRDSFLILYSPIILKKEKINSFLISVYIAVICFLTYATVYAFRKPFTIGLYLDEPKIFGVDYKNILVIAQVLGYTISKFYGIKFIAELNKVGRGWSILILIILSFIPLLLFPLFKSPWNIVFLFLNGLPLGVLWGLIFSFVEGRKTSDFIGATMAVSFIVSSGFVKTVAKWIQLTYQVQENWIPFYTGLVFLIPVIILVYLLEKIPDPTPIEAAEKSIRVPMDKNERKRFFNMFSFGLVSFIFIYILLTLFRDIRDNFAADIWLELGYGNSAGIFTSTELPIAFSVLVLIASMIYINNNKLAFQISQIIILAGFIICGISTFLFMQQIIAGYLWIVLVGLGLYMGYIPFNCILFDRMIASFKIKGNVGYFMYLVDSFGYLASVLVIVLKGSMGISISWTYFYSNGVLVLSIMGSLISITTLLYFNKKYKTYNYE
jgi:hypothetical protein